LTSGAAGNSKTLQTTGTRDISGTPNLAVNDQSLISECYADRPGCASLQPESAKKHQSYLFSQLSIDKHLKLVTRLELATG
jgi:hypothetical protein